MLPLLIDEKRVRRVRISYTTRLATSIAETQNEKRAAKKNNFSSQFSATWNLFLFARHEFYRFSISPLNRARFFPSVVLFSHTRKIKAENFNVKCDARDVCCRRKITDSLFTSLDFLAAVPFSRRVTASNNNISSSSPAHRSRRAMFNQRIHDED